MNRKFVDNLLPHQLTAGDFDEAVLVCYDNYCPRLMRNFKMTAVFRRLFDLLSKRIEGIDDSQFSVRLNRFLDALKDD
ncbi:ORF128 [Leucania separata nucleopolyhedrovirus]|uniref:ORF128 n=1 Tax=Leucania separata nucleopolyhedrovirus TaxID=1307956 RepID=Q0IKZ1_NPVLS|nr:ORF128 [Leucania separata nucleopolyhedrovirus]AAR28892.1 ORF128 [Leucania separata nucleopolyhedrovirus]